MAISNAERQARHRERVKAKLAAVAEPARDDEEAAKLRKQVARLKEQLAEKEAQRAAQRSLAKIAERQADVATNRAMFAEADKERLEQELEELRNGDGTREEGLQAAEDMLLDQYYGTGETWLRFLNVDVDNLSHRDNTEVAAANRFQEERIGFADIMLIVGMAAFDRLNQFYEEEAAGGGKKAGEFEWRKHAETIALRNDK